MNNEQGKDRPNCITNHEGPQQKEIDVIGLHQFCSYNDNDTMVILLDAVMDEDIDGDALSEAVRQAEQRYANFGCGLGTTGNGLCYIPLASAARAYEDVPGKKWLLGTDETAGRLYRVTYAGPRIMVSLHHGLTDGRGAFEYLKTLLYYYLTALGHSVDPEGKVLLVGEVPANEDEYPCAKYAKRGDQGRAANPPAAKLFGIKEDYLDERGDYLCRRVEVTAPVESVVSVARGAQTTVTSLLVAVINRAIAQTYHPVDEMLLSCVTTDLRPLFGSATLRNFSGIALLAEVPQMRSMPIEAEAQVLGEQLAAAHNVDAALGRLSGRIPESERLMATPVDKLFGNGDAVMVEKRGVRSSLANLVTNVGAVELPTGVQKYVRQAAFRIPSFSATMSMAVCSSGDTLTINMMQPFENEALSRALVDILSQLGIAAQRKDWGLEGYDILGRDAVIGLA